MDEALVIGPGAIGLAVAAALTDFGAPPGFIGRGGPAAVAARLGDRALRFPAADPARAALAFVAVKAFDLAAALQWTQALPAGAAVVPLSNGAVEPILAAAAARRPDLRWRLGYGTLGVTATGPSAYAVRSRAGEIAFGPFAGDAAPTPLESGLAAAPGFFRWHPGILRLQRRKWLYNTVINTLAAARRLPRNGDLLADRAALAAVFDEGYRLGAEHWGPWPEARAELYAGMLALIEATAENENSMARDVRLGRRTESGFLAGAAAGRPAYPLLGRLHAAITSPA